MLLLHGDRVIRPQAEDRRCRGEGKADRRPAPRGSRQRRGQAGRSRPENPPGQGKRFRDDGVEAGVAGGIQQPQARRVGGRQIAKTGRQLAWNEANFARDSQIAAFHRAAHGRKRGCHHGDIAIEGSQRGGHFAPHIAAESGIDLLEEHARL